jgi:hypothetical protein
MCFINYGDTQQGDLTSFVYYEKRSGLKWILEKQDWISRNVYLPLDGHDWWVVLVNAVKELPSSTKLWELSEWVTDWRIGRTRLQNLLNYLSQKCKAVNETTTFASTVWHLLLSTD